MRFSTVGGESGSADTARDPRGFAVKFYTEEGNWDLVGNNTPASGRNLDCNFLQYVLTHSYVTADFLSSRSDLVSEFHSYAKKESGNSPCRCRNVLGFHWLEA